VIVVHADGGDEVLSFQDIARDSSRFAHYLAAVFPDQDHFHPTLTNDKEGISRIVFENDHTTLGVRLFSREFDKPNELGVVELRKERYGSEKIGCFHARKIVRGFALGSGNSPAGGLVCPPLMTLPGS
jgi:hypothetical protein